MATGAVSDWGERILVEKAFSGCPNWAGKGSLKTNNGATQ